MPPLQGLGLGKQLLTILPSSTRPRPALPPSSGCDHAPFQDLGLSKQLLTISFEGGEAAFTHHPPSPFIPSCLAPAPFQRL